MTSVGRSANSARPQPGQPVVPRRQFQRGAVADALDLAFDANAAHTNGGSKPFVWTKSADAILASVARFCKNNS